MTPSRLRLFLDADVVIAGSASPDGASHALFQVAELGLVEAWTSPGALTEVRRNLLQKLPRGLPIFEALWPKSLQIGLDPDEQGTIRYADYAHVKDVHVAAAAIQAQANWLVTFNVRHFYSPPGLIVVRPGDAVQRIRGAIGRLAADSLEST